MNIQQLRYIVALDEHRHFARAAEVCMITQPGLTIQLKNLEEEIGIRIFDRTKVPLKPTPMGEEIISRAKKVLREADGIRDFVIGRKDDLEGTITLGVISTLAPYLIPGFIKLMKEMSPKLHLTIKELNTGQLMEYVQTGAIDIALMATPTGHPGLREHPVFNEPFVAYLNESHPRFDMPCYEMAPRDKDDLLLLQQEYCFNAQLLDICGIKAGKSKAMEFFSYEIASVETLKNMVKAGLGFAIVPQLSTEGEADMSGFKPFPDPKPAREISLVVADTFTRKLLLEKMSRAIWDCLPDAIRQRGSYRKIQWNDSPYFINAVNSHRH